MPSAEDAERAYDRAGYGIVSARATMKQYADHEATITTGQREAVRRADAAAGEAERRMAEAVEIIRAGLLGWPPPEPPRDSSERAEDG